MTTIRLRGGRVFDPANGVDGELRDVVMRDGRLVAAGSREPADRGIGIDANHQPVAKVTGCGEVVDMPKMQDVKAAVGENDPLALGFPVCHRLGQLRPALNLGLDFIEKHG